MLVVVVPPSAVWAEQFASEAARLRRTLTELDVDLQHIGSTAIPGIYAKPVIDMLLLVDDLPSLDMRSPALQQLGYEVMGEFGIPGRRYFRKNSPQGERTHHLHAFVRGTPGAVRHAAFRDYMIAHPAIAQEYSTLKRQLAAAHPNDMQAYIRGKDAFIQHHEALALRWLEAGNNRTS